MNPSRKPLIAGNWKMNRGGIDGVRLAMEVKELAASVARVELLVAPPFTALAAVALELEDTGVLVGAQNMHPSPSGAFTGEVSGPMLVESGATWVIIGHSERRQLFGERDGDVVAKIRGAIRSGIAPVACVGETLAEREAGNALAVVGAQVEALLDAFSDAPLGGAIAYEPVWAIGTGRNASPADAELAHAAIRGWLLARSAGLAARTRIIYGGSVRVDNAQALLAQPNVDGALIGGASLEIGSFGGIAMAAETLARAS